VKLKFFSMAIATCGTLLAQSPGTEPDIAKPGVKEVQVPFASLRPSATFRIGKTADWVLITDNAVWVAATEPYSVVRIDPATNKIAARVEVRGEACSGLAYGFGSIWVPLCGERGSLARVDADTNIVRAILPIGPAEAEAGITASEDSIWMMTDKKGTLSRIDPATGTVRQRISIPPGSYNPLFYNGIIWVTGFDDGVLTAVDASSGEVFGSITVGPKPRFLTAGSGSVWTLNQGDGSVSRVDIESKKLTATIRVGTPGPGGEILYGGDSVWTTSFGVPLTLIDPVKNQVMRQWVGNGGDAARFGHNSIWLTDYHKGLLWRIPYDETARP
jgi:virginiamycin B lyase